MTPAVLAGIMQQQKESAEVERYLYALEKPEQAMIYAVMGKFFHEKGLTKNCTGVLPTQKRGAVKEEDKKRKGTGCSKQARRAGNTPKRKTAQEKFTP